MHKEDLRALIKKQTDEYEKKNGKVKTIPVRTVADIKREMMENDWRYKAEVEYRQRMLESLKRNIDEQIDGEC